MPQWTKEIPDPPPGSGWQVIIFLLVVGAIIGFIVTVLNPGM